MLGWSASELSNRVGISRNSIQRLERFSDIPPSRTQSLLELKRVFEQAGIEFIEDDGVTGPGVRLARSLHPR